MTVKKYLADLYGCTEGYHYNTLSEERLLKKIQFYSEFLETVGSVDPGFTKVRYLFFVILAFFIAFVYALSVL